MLLAEYTNGTGGDSFVGWSYPSVFRTNLSNGSRGFRMLYTAALCPSDPPGCWTNRNASIKTWAVLSESLDGIAWSPARVPPISHAPAGALWSPGGYTEIGFVLDETGAPGVPPSQALKMLLSNASLLVSDDGVGWADVGLRWADTGVDPGFHALRSLAPGAPLVITARPQALRPQGRHAGAVSGATWTAVAASDVPVAEPIDSLLYAPFTQMYGFPAWDYAKVLTDGAFSAPFPPTGDGDLVAFVWR
jgi:hypothetical protein